MEKQLQEMAAKQDLTSKSLEERLRAMEVNRNTSVPSNSSGFGSQQRADFTPHELSGSQLAARNAVAKELPPVTLRSGLCLLLLTKALPECVGTVTRRTYCAFSVA